MTTLGGYFTFISTGYALIEIIFYPPLQFFILNDSRLHKKLVKSIPKNVKFYCKVMQCYNQYRQNFVGVLMSSHANIMSHLVNQKLGFFLRNTTSRTIQNHFQHVSLHLFHNNKDLKTNKPSLLLAGEKNCKIFLIKR